MERTPVAAVRAGLVRYGLFALIVRIRAILVPWGNSGNKLKKIFAGFPTSWRFPNLTSLHLFATRLGWKWKETGGTGMQKIPQLTGSHLQLLFSLYSFATHVASSGHLLCCPGVPPTRLLRRAVGKSVGPTSGFALVRSLTRIITSWHFPGMMRRGRRVSRYGRASAPRVGESHELACLLSIKVTVLCGRAVWLPVTRRSYRVSVSGHPKVPGVGGSHELASLLSLYVTVMCGRAVRLPVMLRSCRLSVSGHSNTPGVGEFYELASLLSPSVTVMCGRAVWLPVTRLNCSRPIAFASRPCGKRGGAGLWVFNPGCSTLVILKGNANLSLSAPLVMVYPCWDSERRSLMVFIVHIVQPLSAFQRCRGFIRQLVEMLRGEPVSGGPPFICGW